MEYAGFWRRTLALVVDLLVAAPLLALTLVLMQASIPVAIVAELLGGLLFAYHVYFHARWGQTLGKMAAKIRVVQLDGTPITVRHAVLRESVDLILWVAYAVPTLWVLATWDGPAWSSLDWIAQRDALDDRNVFYRPYDVVSQVWIWSEVVVLLLNKKRRALHDFIAGTVVVKVLPEQRSFGIEVPRPEAQTR